MAPVEFQSNALLNRGHRPRVEAAARHLEKVISKHMGVAARERPTMGIVLGSAFGGVAEALTDAIRVPFRKLPGFAPTSVPGHAGEVILGRLAGQSLWVISGRLHYYEGFSMEEVTHPIRVLARLGVRNLVLTNAAGTLNRKYAPGSLLLLTDHLNFMGANPLRGCQGNDRFVDLSHVYDPALGRVMLASAKHCRVKMHRGVYVAVSGPSYETPAEIRAFQKWGADAVGMSTVPEAVVARQCGMRVLGLSCLTNWAAGMSPRRRVISHEEVLDMSRKCARDAGRVLEAFVQSSKPAGKPDAAR